MHVNFRVGDVPFLVNYTRRESDDDNRVLVKWNRITIKCLTSGQRIAFNASNSHYLILQIINRKIFFFSLFGHLTLSFLCKYSLNLKFINVTFVFFFT